MTQLKNVPKSHVYRIMRKGEVRVNMKRISPFYRLNVGDQIRLPPLAIEDKVQLRPNSRTMSELTKRILYEDESIIILNKPAGMPVHAGSTVKIGVIETLRYCYPSLTQLELAHRLDSETSGCLILAKKKRVLREVHTLLREGKITKIYWALTKGKWTKPERIVHEPLLKNDQNSGRHQVSINKAGKSALTSFKPIQVFKDASLVEAQIFTGRTHQIRVHAQSQNHPIAGDDRYGDDQFNKLVSRYGLKRMFLHARSIDFILPSLKQRITVVAPLDQELEQALKSFEC